MCRGWVQMVSHENQDMMPESWKRNDADSDMDAEQEAPFGPLNLLYPLKRDSDLQSRRNEHTRTPEKWSPHSKWMLEQLVKRLT